MASYRAVDEARIFVAAQRESELSRLARQESGLEARREHEAALRSLLQGLTTFGGLPSDAYFANKPFEVDTYSGLAIRAASGILGTYYSSFDPDTLERLQSGLVDEFQSGAGSNIADLVARAVVKAVREEGRRTDWRFVTGIILALLMFLASDVTPNADQRELREAVEQVRQRLSAQKELVEMLITRRIVRPTVLRARPSSKSRVLVRVGKNTRVVVIARRNKWTLVAVPNGKDGSEVIRGWVLNKYLE
jgi:hypothetical protein